MVRFGLDGDFPGIGELDRIADEIDQDLGQAAAVAVARGYLRGFTGFSESSDPEDVMALLRDCALQMLRPCIATRARNIRSKLLTAARPSIGK